MSELYLGISLLSCVDLIVLMVFAGTNSRIPAEKRNSFLLAYSILMLAIIADVLSTALNGAPQWTTGLHTVMKCFDYIITPAVSLSFMHQFSTTKNLTRPVYIILICNAIFEILSCFTGWTFYIDADNYYQYGPLRLVYSGVYVACIVFVIISIVKFARKYKHLNLGPLLAILIMTLVGALAQEFFSNIRISNLSITVACTLLYIYFCVFMQYEDLISMQMQQDLLYKDPLTGLFSKYYYDCMIADYKNGKKMEENLALIEADIDGLKLINETKGHEAGDKLVKEFADCMEEVLSPYGQCIRIGGDKFIARILTSDKTAEELAGKLEALAKSRDMAVSVGAAGVMDDSNEITTIDQLIAMANKQMYQCKGRKKIAEVARQQTEKTTEELLEQVVMAMESSLAIKDSYTQGHSIRVAQYSELIARYLGYSEKRVTAVKYMALLHDIGKIGVKNDILNKNGALEGNEVELIRQHTIMGSDILQNITSIPNLYMGARWHHERIDGKGYPDGLTGDQIPEEVRIISVADAFDAMTSNRSYRKKLPFQEAKRRLIEGADTQFDRRMVEAFADIIDNGLEEDTYAG